MAAKRGATASCGDARLLREVGARLGMHAEIVPPMDVDGTPVSSSAIRTALQRGDVVGAARMLGRPYFVTGALSREATVFDNAFTVAPLTLPAHASLLTAAYPPRHGVHDNHVSALGTDVPTFPVRLRARGYATAAFVSAIVLDHRYGLSRGFDTYDDEIAGPERSAAETLARAERWIEAAPRPLFTWIHLFEPHAPYRSGSYEGEVKAVDVALDAFFGFLRGKRFNVYAHAERIG